MARDIFRIGYSARMLAEGSDSAEIMLYGEIVEDGPDWWKWSSEDKSAAEFDRAVKEIKGKGASKLLLRINSPGGVCTEAVAMRSILANAGFEEIDIRIEGMCASAATIIAALPGAHVAICEGSEYMIHNPWCGAVGNAAELEYVAGRLRSIEEMSRGFYAKRSGQSEERIREWMDAETWFTARQAVEHGFADEVLEAEATPAAACVSRDEMAVMRGMYRSVPEGVRTEEEDDGMRGSAGQETTLPAGKPATSTGACRPVLAENSPPDCFPRRSNPDKGRQDGGRVKAGIRGLRDRFRAIIDRPCEGDGVNGGPAESAGGTGGADAESRGTGDGGDGARGTCQENRPLDNPESAEAETGRPGSGDGGDGDRGTCQENRPTDNFCQENRPLDNFAVRPALGEAGFDTDGPGDTGRTGGGTRMTLEELREQDPELAEALMAAARAGVSHDEAVQAERQRIADIDAIAGMFDPEVVAEAKYGKPCTAQEMAYRAAVRSAQQGGQFLSALRKDFDEGGAAGVGAAPAEGEERPMSKEDMKAAGQAMSRRLQGKEE